MKLGPSRTASGSVAASVAGSIALVVSVCVVILWLGCQSQAGMFCQQQSECRVGLVCTKSPGTATPTSYGVCVPARRGTGEPCQRSSECEIGLRCTIEIGIDNGDERHGICEMATDAGAVDMTASDAQSPPG
jgi:hypothetical protein